MTIATLIDVCDELGQTFARCAKSVVEDSTTIHNATIMCSEGIVNLEKLADDLHGQYADIAKAMNTKPGSPLHPGQALGAEETDLTKVVDQIIDSNENFSGIDPQVVGYLYKAAAVNKALKTARDKGDGDTVNRLMEYLKKLEPFIQMFDPKIFRIDSFLDLVEKATTNAITKAATKAGGTSGGGSGGFSPGVVFVPLAPGQTLNPANLQQLLSQGVIRG
jgi:hypothetical protein